VADGGKPRIRARQTAARARRVFLGPSRMIASDAASTTLEVQAMSFYIAKTIQMPFDAAIEKVIAALKEEGFGVLTDIDVRSTLKTKLGIDWQPYRILGACNPQLAHRALQAEDKIGVMLPCNIILQEVANGEVEVATIDPTASMERVGKPALSEIAETVRNKLSAVLARL
jgi:uncharacterized protein (DUF302 family)